MKKLSIFFLAFTCFVSVCLAEEVPTVIAISADGSEFVYEMATVQKITFVQDAESSSMTIDRKGVHPDVTGVQCVMFGVRNLLPTVLESVADSETKVYIFPNPVKNLLLITGVNESEELTVYDITGLCLLQTTGNSLEVSLLSSGIYFLKVKNQILKFVKK